MIMERNKQADTLILLGSHKPEPEETYKTFREGKEDLDLEESEKPSPPETEKKKEIQEENKEEEKKE